MKLENISQCRLLLFLSLISMLPFSTLADEPLIVTPVPYEELCSDYDQVQLYEQETFEDFIKSREGYPGSSNSYFFSIIPLIDGERVRRWLGHETYNVPVGAVVTFELRIYTTNKPETRIRYMGLLNEQLIPLSQDPAHLSEELTLISGEMASFTLTLPSLEEGVSDFVFLFIPDVDQPLRPTGSPIGHHARISLLVGDDALSQMQEPVYTLLPTIGKKSAGDPYHNIAVTLDDSFMQWNYPHPTHVIAPDEPLTFNVITGGPGDNARDNRFALMGFVDYQPVTLQDSVSVIYGELLGDTAYTRIPIQTQLDLPPGVYDVLLVKLYNPRIPSCVLLDNSRYYPLQIMRVALEIR